MPSTAPISFDDFLERLLGGEDVEVTSFIEAHPELSEDERQQLRRLCARPPADHDSAMTIGGGPPAASDASPIPRIGALKLGRRIGAGGMGAVFLAEDESLGRTVAVKILGPDLAGSGERAERFLREVRAVARLRHPNIVTVHAAGEEHGVRYMAMELIAGSSLHDVIGAAATAGSRIPVAEVVGWGIEMAGALQAAHEAGIIHRDVKPSNIRIATDGRAVLLDFGLANDAGAATLTESGAFRGSPQYASPEQVRASDVAIDARTDIYSLGATLYEALAGVSPFRGQTREQLFHQILTRDPVPLRRLDPAIPRDLETVVLATLEKDPARRHPSAAALAADLQAVREGRPVSVRPPSAAGRVVRWAKRQPAKAALLASLIVAIPLLAVQAGFILANLSKIEEATAAGRARELDRILQDAFLEHGEGDPERAHGLFDEALRKGPDSLEANAGYALNLVQMKKHEAALTFLDGAAARHASAGWSIRIRLEALTRLGRDDEAKALTSKLPLPGPAIDHFVAGMLGLARFHSNDRHDTAVGAFRHLQNAVLGASPAIALYHYELGHAAWHAEQPQDAKDVAVSIRNLWPPSPEQAFAIGRTLFQADRKAALDALEEAARSPPRSLPAREFVMVNLSTSGRPEAVARAYELAQEAVRLNPGRARSHLALGIALLARGDVDAAIETLSTATRLDPALAAAHTKLADAWLDKGDFQRAVLAARESIRLRTGEPTAWAILGSALLSLEEFEEAVKALERARELAPNDPGNLCNLGRGLLRTGEFTKAVEGLKKGHEIGSALPAWKHPSQRWVSNAERLVQLEKRLEEVRRGAGKPPSSAERVNLAREICVPKRRFAEAAALFEAAFAADSSLPSRRQPPLLVEAAAAAVAAGLGRGVDGPADDGGRAKLRDRARGWLEEELASCEAALKDEDEAPPVAARLEPWAASRLLAVTRDSGVMPGPEAESWSALWKRRDALLRSQ